MLLLNSSRVTFGYRYRFKIGEPSRNSTGRDKRLMSWVMIAVVLVEAIAMTKDWSASMIISRIANTVTRPNRM